MLPLCVDDTQIISFFNDTATTEIYPLSLHDALPIFAFAPPASARRPKHGIPRGATPPGGTRLSRTPTLRGSRRSEEHTSELQSRQYLVCRLLLEQKTNIHSSNSSLPISPIR